MEFEPKLHLPFFYLIGSYFLFQHIDLGLGYYLFFFLFYIYIQHILLSRANFLDISIQKKGKRLET